MAKIARDDVRLSENIFVDSLQNVAGLAHQFEGSVDVSRGNTLNRELLRDQTKELNDIVRAYHNVPGYAPF